MNSTRAISGVVLAVLLGGACGPSYHGPLPPTPEMTLRDLGGFWFDIAHLPQAWSTDCSNTLVAFGPAHETQSETSAAISCSLPKGDLLLEGTLRVVDLDQASFELTLTSGRQSDTVALQVHAMGPMGDWILAGDPERDLLWVLAREADWSTEEINATLPLVAPLYGFSPRKLPLERTPHRY